MKKNCECQKIDRRKILNLCLLFTDGVGEGLLLGCMCKICLGRFFGFIGAGMGIFGIFGRFISLPLSILFIIWCAVGDGINVLFWFVLLFLFKLDLFVLSNKSIFSSEDIFWFPSILFFGISASYCSETRLEFECLCGFWDIIFIWVTLFFVIILLVVLFPNESTFRS